MSGDNKQYLIKIYTADATMQRNVRNEARLRKLIAQLERGEWSGPVKRIKIYEQIMSVRLTPRDTT